MYIFNEALLMLGGITVFLLGLTDISENMSGLSGARMKGILQKCSSGVFRGVFTGAAVTAIAQSSIAVNVVAIGFTESGLLSFYSAAAIVMGANIGTTVTAQIVSLSGNSSFDVTAFGSLIAFGGMILGFVVKNKSVRSVGGVMVGFGLIFIGLEIMGDSIGCFKGFEWFRNIFLIENPIVLLLNGIVLTAIMQSSSAVTGVMIVLASGGLLGFKSSMFLILGANIGSCFPVILSAMNKSESARKVAVFNLLFNVFGAAVFFFPLLIWGDSIALLLSGVSAARAVANFHTVFNVLVTSLVLPVLKPFSQVVSLLVKNRDKKDKNLAKRKTFKYL